MNENILKTVTMKIPVIINKIPIASSKIAKIKVVGRSEGKVGGVGTEIGIVNPSISA